MASPLAPEEGAAAYAAVSKNVDAGQGGTVRRPGPLRVLHPDVSEFLLGTRRRRIKKQAPAMPPPAAEGEEDGGERARYGCAFEHEGAEQEKRGFAPPRLVWGKVNNHPWWPGRLFDPADASELAQKHRRRRGATLVAYFWDKTFAWADAVALRPFRGCFPRLAGQSNMSTFASAVDAALAEVARRVDVGLSCSCAGSNAIVKKQVIDSAGVGEGAYGAMVDAAWRRGAPTNTSTPLPLPIIFLFRCGKLAGRHSLLRPSVSAGSPSASPIVIVRSPHSPRTQISSPKAFLFTTKMKPESCRSLFWNEGGIHSRKYNTYADDEDKRSPPLPTYADDEDKLSPPPPAPISLLNSPYDPPNLKSFSIGYGESAKLLERLDHDIRLLVQEGLDIAKMKSLYKELVRPSLVSSCLLHAEPLNSPNTKVLDDKYRETLKRPPAYITTLDLMTKLFSLHPTKWIFLLDFLRDHRDLVIENWYLSIGSIEFMMYDHGLRPLLRDQILYKGQSDASFAQNTSGKADLCTIIWREDEVVDCIIYRGVPCDDSMEAELKAMYLLQSRGIENKISAFYVTTDNEDVDRTVRETYPIEGNTKHRDLCLLLRCLKRYFKCFLCKWEPREKLHFPDSLLQCKESHLTMEYIKDSWSYILSGSPLFRVHQTRKKIERNYFAKAPAGGKLYLHNVYRVDAECHSRKVAAVVNIVLSMKPPLVSVLVRDQETALLVKDDLEKVMTKTYGMELENSNGHFIISLAIMEMQNASCEGKTLDIIYHAALCKHYTANKKSLCVQLLTSMDKEFGCPPELSPVCYLFFNGPAAIDIET